MSFLTIRVACRPGSVDESAKEYFQVVSTYIHLNPVRGGLMPRIEPLGGGQAIVRVDVVLDQNRDAMQRAAGTAILALAIQRRGDRQGVGIQFNDRLQARSIAVQVFKASQIRFGNFDGLEPTTPVTATAAEC